MELTGFCVNVPEALRDPTVELVCIPDTVKAKLYHKIKPLDSQFITLIIPKSYKLKYDVQLTPTLVVFTLSLFCPSSYSFRDIGLHF